MSFDRGYRDLGIEPPWLGIALFTFHKYRKSLESSIPLDAHGNPVTGDDDADYAGEASQVVAEEECIHLTSEADFGEVIRTNHCLWQKPD